MKWRLLHQDSIPSTNDELESRVLHGLSSAYDVLLCSHQTKGHGRFERVWVSPPGNIAMSLALPASDSSKIYQVNALAALSLIKVLEPLLVERPQLKWPNDVLVSGKKLSGILSKFLAEKEIIILGIGVNFNSKIDDFPLTLRKTLTTLLECTRCPQEQNHFVESFLKQFAEIFNTWEKKGLGVYLNDLWAVTVKGDVTVHEQGLAPYNARILNIDENGFLKILTDNGGIKTIVAADITTH